MRISLVLHCAAHRLGGVGGVLREGARGVEAQRHGDAAEGGHALAPVPLLRRLAGLRALHLELDSPALGRDDSGEVGRTDGRALDPRPAVGADLPGGLSPEGDAEARGLALTQFASATNMTDSAAALVAIANSAMPERKQVLEQFHARWKDEPLVVDKWLLVQATSRLAGTLAEVEALMRHPSFDIRNPNKVYALIRAFCANHLHFHAADGSGYAFGAARVIELDALNPQVASRVARSFDRWRKFDAGRQAHAKRALEQIRRTAGLSRDVSEIVTKALFES